MSILLKEGRKEDLKKKYSDKFSQEDLDFILNISDLVDFNHKYTDFVLREIEPGTDVAWWAEEIIDAIKLFHKYQSQLDKKDINQYKSLDELDNALEPFLQKEKERELEKQVDKIYEDDKFIVVKPKTEEASCKYGSNTKWCVTQKNAGHFERYTSGNQGLYFVIDKKNSTNKNYSKIALHFDNSGTLKYWDSTDDLLDRKQISVLEYAFPDLINTIKDDYKKRSLSKIDEFLAETFSSHGVTVSKDDYFSLNTQLNVVVEGFENVEGMGLGHAQGTLTVVLNSKSNKEVIDAYEVFITYKPQNANTFSISVGFMAKDGYEIDLELESWGIDARLRMENSPAITAQEVRKYIGGKVFAQIRFNEKITQKVRRIELQISPDTQSWLKRSIHGYTFGKNKGLISKLIKFLDSGVEGTKLDFLVSIGKLKSKIDGGKKLYARPNGEFLPSSSWRGQHASFFASAKASGILDYKKIGNQFILSKGPNFDAFKEGKLKSF